MRRGVEAFRARHDIVSLERDENQVLSRVKGLGASLNAANDRVAIAEGNRASTASHTRIDDGEMDPEGRGQAIAGLVMGIIGTALAILTILAVVLVIAGAKLVFSW